MDECRSIKILFPFSMNHKNALLLKKGFEFHSTLFGLSLTKGDLLGSEPRPTDDNQGIFAWFIVACEGFTKLSNRWKCVEISATAIKKTNI